MYKTITAALAGIVMTISCKTPDLAIADLPSPEKLDVNGRQGWMLNEKLSFGDVRTVTLKRSWTKGSGAFAGWTTYKPGYNEVERIIGVEYSQRKQSVRFELTDKFRNQSAVFCVTRVKSANFIIGNNPNSTLNTVSDILEIGDDWQNHFWVNIYLKDDQKPWEMVINNNDVQRQRKSYTGMLVRDRENYFTIRPAYTLLNNKGKAVKTIAGSVGYEFLDKNGKTVAAVSLMDNGIVYMGNTTPEERFLLANACAALLLQQQI